MTRFKVAEVDVHIQDVVFCDAVVENKEREEDREENTAELKKD